MTDRFIHTKLAPAAIGPYSQAVLSGGFLFTSGQIPLDPASGELVRGDVKAQARRVFLNLSEVLKASGASFDDVVKTTVFLTSMTDFAALNEIYAEYLGERKPARSTVAVVALPKGAAVEIELVAKIPSH
jgi:2-iminobutanoate/2-iminopropanoate deaminase